mgnify:CR=1 FL=1
MDAFERARKVGETMFAVDTASKLTMGMELLLCEPGRAILRMPIRAMHLNGHQICHGGFIFTLSVSFPKGVTGTVPSAMNQRRLKT